METSSSLVLRRRDYDSRPYVDTYVSQTSRRYAVPNLVKQLIARDLSYTSHTASILELHVHFSTRRKIKSEEAPSHVDVVAWNRWGLVDCDRPDCPGSRVFRSRSAKDAGLVWWGRASKHSAHIPRALANPSPISAVGGRDRVSRWSGPDRWTSKPSRRSGHRRGHVCRALCSSPEIRILYELVWG